MISKTFIEKNGKRLTEEKKRLENLLSRIATKDSAGGDFHAKYPELGNKEDENASEVAMYEVNIAEQQDLEKKLHNVDAALSRIADGTYGICAVGGEEISAERLEAAAEAATCVEHDQG